MVTESHYLVLGGAYANAGDHLIAMRADALLREIRPDREILRLDRGEPLDPSSAEVADAAAILLAGGPAWQESSYPNIYPLTAELDSLRAPIVPIGLGWRADHVSSWTTFQFGQNTRRLLRRIERDGHWGTCRDATTLGVLRRAGLSRQLMAGCPAWYSLDHMGHPAVTDSSLDTIAYSVGARSSTDEQFADLEVAIVRRLVARWPEATVQAVFHHPTTPTPGYPEQRSDAHARLGHRFVHVGASVRDISGSVDGLLDAYEDAAMHVGFRVHAHVQRCALRLPSVLIAEDSRGHVMCASLGHAALAGSRAGETGPVPRLAVIDDLDDLLISRRDDGWPEVETAGAIIDATLPTLRSVLTSLP